MSAAIVSLTGGELERDRRAIGIDQRVALGLQAAARAPHATGPPFIAIGAMLLTPDGRGAIICMSPS